MTRYPLSAVSKQPLNHTPPASEVSRPVWSAQTALAPDAACMEEPANSEWAAPQMWMNRGGRGRRSEGVGVGCVEYRVDLSLKEERGVGVGLRGRGLRWGGGFPLIIHRQWSMRGFFIIGFASDKTWKEKKKKSSLRELSVNTCVVRGQHHHSGCDFHSRPKSNSCQTPCSTTHLLQKTERTDSSTHVTADRRLQWLCRSVGGTTASQQHRLFGHCLRMTWDSPSFVLLIQATAICLLRLVSGSRGGQCRSSLRHNTAKDRMLFDVWKITE